MKPRTAEWLFGIAHAAVWAGFGFWLLPTFERMFGDMLEGATLPAITIALLRIGAAGCILYGLGGGGLVVGLGYTGLKPGVRDLVMMLMVVPLLVAAAALLWPLALG
jgi:hypothetical protein